MAGRFVLTAQLALSGPTNVRPVIASIQKSLNNIKANINLQINQNSVRNLTQLNTTLRTTQQLLQSCATSAASLKSSLSGLSGGMRAANNAANRTATAVGTLNSNVNSTAKATKVAATQMNGLGRSAALAIKKFGSFTLVTSSIIAFTIGIKSAISEALNFQHGLVRLSQITGLSTKNLGGLASEISRLSTELGVSSTELLDISDVLAQAGLSIAQVKTALEGLAKTKLAPTFGELKDTVEASIAAMNQFNIPVEKLADTLGSFNAVAAAFAVESDDLAVAVRRSGSAFKTAGGSLDEFVALFTSVRQTTREGAETIATGFRTIFTRLQRPKTIEYLRTLGIELQNVNGQFVGPYEAVRRLNTALSQLEGTDPQFAKIVEELGGFRQVSKVIPLIQQFATAEKALGVAQQGRNSINKDAQTAQESLIVQLTKLQQKFYELFRTIGNSTAFQGFIKAALTLGDALIGVGNALAPLIPLVATLGALKLGGGLVNFSRSFKAGLGQRTHFASGGVVPGKGGGDTVPAMLTPGEYVINKSAAQSIGYGNLDAVNGKKGGNKVGHYANGGKVGGIGGKIAGVGAIAAVGLIGATFDSLDKSMLSTINSVIGLGIAALYTGKAFGINTTALKKTANSFNRVGRIQKKVADLEVRRQNIATERDVATKALIQSNKDLKASTATALNKRSQYIRSVGTRGEAFARQDSINANRRVLRDRGRVDGFNNTVGSKNIALAGIDSRLNRGRGLISSSRSIRGRFGRGAGIGGAALAAGGVLATGAGAAFSNSAQTNVNNGQFSSKDESNIRTGSTLSGAGSGALTGAALGSLIGPIGTAIGALVGGIGGGLYGLLFSAQEEINAAKDKVESIRFDNTIASLSNDLASSKDGTGDKGFLRSRIKANLVSTQSSITGARTSEQSNQLLNSAKNQLPALKDLGNELATTVSSLSEFRAASGGLGEELIQIISRLSGMNIDEVAQSFEKLIESNKKNVDLQSNLNKSLLALFNQRQLTSKLVRAFVESGRVMDEFNSAASALVSDFKNISFDRDLAGTIKDGLSGNSGNLKGALTQTFGGVGGQETSNLIESLSRAADEAKLLPQVLVNAADSALSTGDEDKAGGFRNAIAEQLRDLDVGGQLRETISAGLNRLSGDSFDQDFLQNIKEDAGKFSEELLQDMQTFFDALSEAAQVAQTQSNNIIKLIQSRGQIEREINDQEINIAKSKAQLAKSVANIGSGDFNKNTEFTSKDLRAVRTETRQIRAQGIGGINGGSNAAELGLAAQVRSTDLVQLQERLQGASLFGAGGGGAGGNAIGTASNQAADSIKSLTEQIVKAEGEYDRLITEIKDQAENTAVLNSLTDELNKASEARTKRKDLATELGFAGREGRQDFASSIQAASIVAKNPNAIGSAKQEQKALSGLDRLIDAGAGDVKLSAFNNQSAKQVKDARTTAFLKSQGLTDAEAKQIVDVSKSEIEIQHQIVAEQGRMIDAQIVLKNITVDKLTKLNDSIETGFANMVATFEASVAQTESSQKDAAAKSSEVALNDASRKVTAKSELQTDLDSLGLSNLEKLPVDELSQIKDIDKKNEKLRQIQVSNLGGDLYNSPEAKEAINSTTDKKEGKRRAFQAIFAGTGNSQQEIDDAFSQIDTDIQNGMDRISAENKASNTLIGKSVQNTKEKGQITTGLKAKGFNDTSIHTLTNDDALRGRIVSNQGIAGTATLAQLQADEQKALDTNISATGIASKARASLDSKTQTQENVRQQAKARAEAQAATQADALSGLISKQNAPDILSSLPQDKQDEVNKELEKRAEQSAISTHPLANEVKRIELAQRGKRQTPAGKAALDAARQKLLEGNQANVAAREAFRNNPLNTQSVISDLGLAGPKKGLGGVNPGAAINNGRPIPQGRPPVNQGVNNKLSNVNSISLNDNGLGSALQEFSGHSNGLATALNNMPRDITMTAKIEPIQVIINGADTLSSLQPMIAQIVNEQINKAFPGKGPATPINTAKNTKNQGIA